MFEPNATHLSGTLTCLRACYHPISLKPPHTHSIKSQKGEEKGCLESLSSRSLQLKAIVKKIENNKKKNFNDRVKLGSIKIRQILTSLLLRRRNALVFEASIFQFAPADQEILPLILERH